MNDNHFLKGGSKAALFLFLTVSPLLNAHEVMLGSRPKLPLMRRLQTQFWRLSIRAGQHMDKKVAAIGALSGGLLLMALWHRHSSRAQQQHIEQLMREKQVLTQRIADLENTPAPPAPQPQSRLQRLRQGVSSFVFGSLWSDATSSGTEGGSGSASMPGSGA